MSNDMLKVNINNGKYTLIQDRDGKLLCLRYGEEWRDLTGDGLVCAMGYKIDSLEELNSELSEALEECLECEFPVTNKDTIKKALKAIAKAKGKSND